MARRTSDAQSIMNVPVDDSSIGNGKVLAYNSTSGALEYVTPSGAGDMLTSTYDAANVAEQLVGLTAIQTLTNKTLTSPVLNTGVSGTAVLDEDNMASNSATQLATQQSIKAYVDGTNVTLAGTGTYITIAGQVITVDPITESDIADLGAYITGITGEPLSDLSDVTITTIASGEILKWNGSAWINQTLAEAGIQGVLSEGAFVDGDKTLLDAAIQPGDSITTLDATAYRVFYSDVSGNVTELALGASGTYLQSNGASSAPTWVTPAGTGDVVKVGTPVDNQIGVWTGDGTLEGDANFTYTAGNETLSVGGTGANIALGGTVFIGNVAGTFTLKNIDALDATTQSTFESTLGFLANVVEDTTPQLGGMLDVNSQAIGDGTRELITFTEDASAVNHVNIENEATGAGPIISAAGDDTNIDLNLSAKGTGNIVLVNELDANAGVINNTAGFQINNGGSILDGNFNELAKFVTTGSAVNELSITNAATGNAPSISATGSDTNIDLNLVPKGTGLLKSGGENVIIGLTGAGAPVTTPKFEGQIYTDTTNDLTYIATGTASSADWKVQAAGTAGTPGKGSILAGDGTDSFDEVTAGTNDQIIVYDSAESLGVKKVDLDSGINFIIDGGGSAITTGIKGDIEIPFDCTVESVTLLADQSGSIVVDIWKDTYANFPPTDADSITASAVPTITTATKSQDATLTGWTTTLTKGDVLRYNVDSITTCERVTVSLKVRRNF